MCCSIINIEFSKYFPDFRSLFEKKNNNSPFYAHKGQN